MEWSFQKGGNMSSLPTEALATHHHQVNQWLTATVLSSEIQLSNRTRTTYGLVLTSQLSPIVQAISLFFLARSGPFQSSQCPLWRSIKDSMEMNQKQRLWGCHSIHPPCNFWQAGWVLNREREVWGFFVAGKTLWLRGSMLVRCQDFTGESLLSTICSPLRQELYDTPYFKWSVIKRRGSIHWLKGI